MMNLDSMIASFLLKLSKFMFTWSFSLRAYTCGVGMTNDSDLNEFMCLHVPATLYSGFTSPHSHSEKENKILVSLV